MTRTVLIIGFASLFIYLFWLWTKQMFTRSKQFWNKYESIKQTAINSRDREELHNLLHNVIPSELSPLASGDLQYNHVFTLSAYIEGRLIAI
jgi:hypothetical protein